MATDEEEARKRCNAHEAALDAVSEDFSPVLVAKVVRRVLTACSEYGALNMTSDAFEDALREIGETLNVPYVELTIAAQAGITNPDTRRDDLAAWVAWCQQYAPERLAMQKGGA